MSTKQILKALPEITSIKFRSNYSAHVRAAEPKVLASKALASSNRNMRSAFNVVVGGLSVKKGKYATE
jgi:hypothetical protein